MRSVWGNMQTDKAIRNARMVKAYQHARNGHSIMARIYASSAAAVYPLTGGQRRRLECLIKEG